MEHSTPRQRVLKDLADRIAADPVIQPRPRPWPFGELTDMQLAQRQMMERAMERGELRGVPSVFGELR